MDKLLVVCLIGGGLAAQWSYKGDHGPSFWSSLSPLCSGKHQSPIDIPAAVSSILKYSANLGGLNLVGYNMTTKLKQTLTNNGHTAVVSLEPSRSAALPTMSGGGLSGQYTALQFHFHWGLSDTEGSEHTFRGLKYPLELHIVHYKTIYGTLTEALDHDDGLAVLGFFFVLSKKDNSKLNPLIPSLSRVPFKDTQLLNITCEGDTANVRINIDDIMATDRKEFYRYNGSLTTPGCNEVVVWTVFEGKIPISSRQLAKFRQLYEGGVEAEEYKLLFNYRPIQNLYSREVYKNYKQDVPSSFHYRYEGHQGAENWHYYYETCKDDMQSPIDIPAPDGGEMARFDPSMRLDSLQFSNYNTEINGTLTNNGHSGPGILEGVLRTVVIGPKADHRVSLGGLAQVNIHNSDIGISEGGLSGQYTATQFHFHWGRDDQHGSEHTREGRAYPLELHIVHYKTEYTSLMNALDKHDGLAVVAFFFTLDSEHNPGLSNLIKKLPDVRHNGVTTQIKGFTLEDITISNLKTNATYGRHVPYFRYAGGLTTPPCFQVVTWTVMRDPVPISGSQLAEFRKLYYMSDDGHGRVHSSPILENYRPTQPLNSRRVFTSIDMINGE